LAMLVVGVLTGLGTWAIGLPAPVALGVIAGLGDFVPIVGPLLAIAPAVLVAFGEGTTTLGLTVVLYIVIQQFEANLLVPLLQRKILSIPPVLLLFSMIAFGFIFGIIGIIVAAPLTIMIYILIREFYVRDLLGQDVLMDATKAVQAGAPIGEAIAATKAEAGIAPTAAAEIP
jgi:predicted PurR-regulated permease PerM